jgi:hypothetical protein
MFSNTRPLREAREGAISIIDPAWPPGFARVTNDILQYRKGAPLDAILKSAQTMQQIMNANVLERRLRINLKCLHQHTAISALAHGT